MSLWVEAASLTTIRTSIAFGKLLDGRIVCTSPDFSGTSARTAEVFDGVSWTTIARPPVEANIRQSGIVLSGGDFMYCPANGSCIPALYSARWNPGADTWTSAEIAGRFQYSIPALIELNNGKVLATLIGDALVSNLPGTSIYDPTGNSWSDGPDVNTPRYGAAIAKLADGRILLIAGKNIDTNTALTVVERANATVTSWTTVASLAHARVFARAVTLQNGKVLVAGGFTLSGGFAAVMEAELYDPTGNTWSSAGTINSPRSGSHSMILLPDGTVLMAGGFADGDGASLATAELYDPDANTWTPIESMINRRADFGLVAYTDSPLSVLAFGGEDYDGVETDVNLDTSETWAGDTEEEGIGTIGGSVAGDPPVVGVTFELD